MLRAINISLISKAQIISWQKKPQCFYYKAVNYGGYICLNAVIMWLVPLSVIHQIP